MGLPDLNKYGFLPKGIHNCTSLDDAKLTERFVEVNNHRKGQWKMLKQYLDNPIVDKICEAVYIDGSFISDKDEPGDIDIVLCLKEDAFNTATEKELNKLFNKVDNKIYYGLEVFPHFSDPNKPTNDFTMYFQYVDPVKAYRKGIANPNDHVKGIIKVDI